MYLVVILKLHEKHKGNFAIELELETKQFAIYER